MKNWVDARLKEGAKHLVVDLESCTAMDSTFMGALANAAMKLADPGGHFQITSANDKNRKSLEDLGLSSIMNINPLHPFWEDQLKDIRSRLSPPKQTNQVDSTQHIFDAHKKLCEADTDNTSKFSAVLDCLEAELASRKK